MGGQLSKPLSGGDLRPLGDYCNPRLRLVGLIETGRARREIEHALTTERPVR